MSPFYRIHISPIARSPGSSQTISPSLALVSIHLRSLTRREELQHRYTLATACNHPHTEITMFNQKSAILVIVTFAMKAAAESYVGKATYHADWSTTACGQGPL